MTAPSDLAARLQALAALSASPTSLVRADVVRWALDLERELPEPPGAVQGLAPWSSWIAVLGAVPVASVSTERASEEPAAAEGPASLERRYLTTEQAAARLGIDRDTLDAMHNRAPKTLPGTPTHVGRGKVRRHLRWSAAELDAWAGAYREWERTRGRR